MAFPAAPVACPARDKEESSSWPRDEWQWGKNEERRYADTRESKGSDLRVVIKATALDRRPRFQKQSSVHVEERGRPRVAPWRSAPGSSKPANISRSLSRLPSLPHVWRPRQQATATSFMLALPLAVRFADAWTGGIDVCCGTGGLGADR